MTEPVDDEEGAGEPEGIPEPRPREELIEFFDRFGYVVLDGAGEYDAFMDFVAKNNIPTWTSVDREAGTVTVHRRMWGSTEGWLPGI